jgi:Do/DeqQ family serine protease
MSSHFKYLLLALILAFTASACRNLTGTEPNPPSSPEAQQPQAPIVVNGIRTSYADVVEKTSPAVVRIEAEHRNTSSQTDFPFGDDIFGPGRIPRGPQIERGIGSGVLVSADGTILTNNHVIDGADKITVILSNNQTYEAKLVGSDPPTDLAVLKIDSQNMPFLTLGNSDAVRVGDIVLAIGNPLGIGQTVTAGIISAKGRRTGLSYGSSNDSFEDFLQTDAPINRGNSGGALVNLNGELIGINSQILSGGPSGGNIGIGFAIPSNMAKSVMEQLLKDGKVRRGMLGINIQDLTGDTAKALNLENVTGVLVSNVRQGSAAEKAGIRRRDVITAVNGEKIEDGNALRNKIASTAPGSEVTLSIIRDGKPMEIKAVLDEYQYENASNQPSSGNNNQQGGKGGKLGITVQPLTDQLARQLQLDSTDGVLVTGVDPSGPAAEAGIDRGDVILELNGKTVKTLDDVQSALEGATGKPVLLLVSRQGRTFYVTVRPQ